ncbi:MAG: uncharacterized protein K0S45_760 [Nitrospira sp.]|jgi:uncharacterized protein (TIGR00251 family)|nr:uncharacterized protein [Nitrospira sp.]
MTSFDSSRHNQGEAWERVVRTMAGGASVSVHVQPKASRSECVGLHGEALKIRVAAPPADGAANAELRRFLARQCDVPLGAVQILSGMTGRKKRVFVKGRSAEQLFQRLQAE